RATSATGAGLGDAATSGSAEHAVRAITAAIATKESEIRMMFLSVRYTERTPGLQETLGQRWKAYTWPSRPTTMRRPPATAGPARDPVVASEGNHESAGPVPACQVATPVSTSSA